MCDQRPNLNKMQDYIVSRAFWKKSCTGMDNIIRILRKFNYATYTYMG